MCLSLWEGVYSQEVARVFQSLGRGRRCVVKGLSHLLDVLMALNLLTRETIRGLLVSFSKRGGGRILNRNVQIWRRKLQVTYPYEAEEWAMVTQQKKRRGENLVFIPSF